MRNNVSSGGDKPCRDSDDGAISKRHPPVVPQAVPLPALVLALALVSTLALAGCGTDGEVTVSAESAGTTSSEVAGDADPADVEVIDEWARTLAAGDADGAARLFAIPSVAQNGLLYPIDDFADARRFNASLPCGGELVEAQDEGNFVVATFVLRERPGAGTCGDGTGETATTAFVIEDGRIVEWRRVFDDGTPTPSRAT
jgi:limonene-1,2-epoxide hydrolase